METIEGVYVANVTPFRDDAALSVDVDSYLAHVSWLGEMGVRVVVPFGTNGEGPSVALREKLWVLEALFARGLSVQVIPAVMQGNLPDTWRWSRRWRTTRQPPCSSCHPTTSSLPAPRDSNASSSRCSRRPATR